MVVPIKKWATKLQASLICVGVAVLLSNAVAGEIHNAAGSGDLETIKRLLDKNPALVNVKDQEYAVGLTPLHVAAHQGQSEVVELLLARGAAVDPKWAVNGMTPLILAAQGGHAEIIRILLGKGANPNNVANGMAALHWVARKGNQEVATLLLNAGADVNIQDSTGKTPLHEAAASGAKEMVEFLISHGAYINVQDRNGNTPWKLAVNHPDIAEALWKQGAMGSKPVTDVLVNRGAKFTNSRVITVDPINDKFPAIAIQDLNNPKDKPVAVQNTGKPFTFTLPDRGDGEYFLGFQFLDSEGKPQETLLLRTITLDTLPPVVKITSPQNNSTTDQGFVHVQASVYDPTARGQKPDEFQFRPLQIWVNGKRFWDRQGTTIDIPRFDVNDGLNTLSIVAEDEASNRTEAVVQWTVNLDLDKTPPVLTDITLHPDKSGKVILTDDPKILVAGHIDDPKAIVTASINGGQPVRMNVIVDDFSQQISNFMSRLPQSAKTNMVMKGVGHQAPMFALGLPLEEGENKLVLSAIDGAGNANDYKFILVRSNRYRFRITSAPFAAIVEGYVGALRDAGTANQAHVVAVFVNDVPTILGPVDADGNVQFRVTGPVPRNWHGLRGVVYVRIKWSDGEEY
ncbi:MAG: ankyrin repeat domain-containing protein [Verrucomicrobiia bacterium]